MTGVDGRILIDNVNRAAWRRGDTVRWFTKLEGWTDPGEKAALEAVTDACRGRPILDLGVGAVAGVALEHDRVAGPLAVDLPYLAPQDRQLLLKITHASSVTASRRAWPGGGSGL